jgi:hypothetical protein
MPNVFGEDVFSVQQIVDVFRKHGDRVRGTYRARYAFGAGCEDPYGPAQLERPESLRGNPPGAIFPWEQIFVAAATCAGSDYPMLAEHLGIQLERVELVVEGVFDPRGEFDGLDGWSAPADAAPCFLSLHLAATLTSDAPQEQLERLHARVVARNMVLGALRGIPRTSELAVRGAGAQVAPPAAPAREARRATPPAGQPAPGPEAPQPRGAP